MLTSCMFASFGQGELDTLASKVDAAEQELRIAQSVVASARRDAQDERCDADALRAEVGCTYSRLKCTPLDARHVFAVLSIFVACV